MDEVSMLSGDLLDKLDYVARTVLHSKEPSGDIQLVLAADFLQLPPVSTGTQHCTRLFDAACWEKCIQSLITPGQDELGSLDPRFLFDRT